MSRDPEEALRAELEEAIATGEPIVGRQNGEQREIPAATLRTAILAGPDEGGHLSLEECRITGQLDLSARIVRHRLRFAACLFEQTLRLGRAQAPSLALEGCTLAKGVSAAQLSVVWDLSLRESTVGSTTLHRVQVGGALTLDDATFSGQVLLSGATIEGELSMTGTHLVNADGYALAADGLQAKSGIQARARFRATGGVSLRSAFIGGALRLENATITAADGAVSALALNAEGSVVRGDVSLRGSSRVRGDIRLAGAEIHESLVIAGCRVEAGRLLLDGASIQGHFELDETSVVNDEGTSLSADRVEIAGALIARTGFECGEISLLQARVGSIALPNANVTGRRVEGSGDRVRRQAIRATRVEVAGNVNLEDAFVEGEIALFAANVGGQISLRRATIRHNGGPALGGDRLEAVHGMFCEGLDAGGELSLRGATVKNYLGLRSVRLEGGKKSALNLSSANIEELCLKPSRITGSVDLRHAAVAVLDDAVNGEPAGEIGGPVRMEGLSYGALREPLDAKRRIPWIEQAQSDGYYPGVYAELVAAYRRTGHGHEARKVAIAGERRARSRLPWWHPRRAWHDLLFLSVGYGYKNWRALGWLALFIVVGGILFGRLESDFSATIENAPAFEPWLYSIDATVPVLDVGQGRAWSGSGMAAWLSTVLAVLGYGLVTAVIAAAAGILNRDQR